MTHEQLLLLLLQVLVVLGVARLLGELARALRQPPMVGEILAGLLLGKTILGSAFPEAFEFLFPANNTQLALFDVTAQLGVLFLLLAIGLEVDVAAAWKMRRQSFSIAVAGVVVPLVLGSAVAWGFYEHWADVPVARSAFSLFVGAAVSITAITVVARLLIDLRIAKSDLGLLLLSAMAINDLLGWGILAVVLALAGVATTAAGPLSALAPVIGALLFAAAGVSWGRRSVTHALQRFEAWQLPTPATPLSFVVCLALACGVVADLIGVHPIFGFLIAGLMASDQSALSEHTRAVITQMVEALFVPIFFAGICLHIDFRSHFVASLVLALTALSVFGKFGGAWLGAYYAGVAPRDRAPIAIAHIPGGSVGVLLAAVGKASGIIGSEMFVAIVFASVASSLVVGPLLAAWLRPEAGGAVALPPAAVLPRLATSTRFGAIDELSMRAASLLRGMRADQVGQAVRQREETMGTGVGMGVAIPHARLEGLEEALVVFGFSEVGIDWNAIDDEPAHFVFLVLTPEDDDDSQLEILKAIGSAFLAESTRDELAHCEGEGAMRQLLAEVFAERARV
jgi:Kef-type K+ transport system membrane component KefB/mannitol/fructose-specific phosphotransferase system IIA component (Ntr-type)